MSRPGEGSSPPGGGRATRVGGEPAAAEADVLVAGGGPAGSAIAARLAALGASVILCEKSRFPREKLCGEFLSPDGVACVDRLGAGPALRGAGPAIIERFLITAPGGGVPVERPLPAPALGISRAALDDLLLRAAADRGARILQACRVISIGGAPGRLAIACEREGEPLAVTARCAVDATGRLGGVRVEGEAPPSTDPPEQIGVQEHRCALAPFPRRVELHAFRGGYAGFNAVEGGRVTCCAIVDAERMRQAGSAERLIEDAARESPALRERLDTLGPRVGDARATARGRQARPRGGLALALGDAAGMIAPACGDGMSMALRSAEIAAPLVMAHLRGSLRWDEVRARCESARNAEMSSRLFWGRVLEAGLLRPGWARMLVAAGRTLPALADGMARATRG